jgi:cephalosporin hydroxylase
MSSLDEFDLERKSILQSIEGDSSFKDLSLLWMNKSASLKHSYLSNWLGVPIIQIPQDVYAMQELIWRVKPDLIIETGIARGGSLQLSASILALLDMSESKWLDNHYSVKPRRKVLGIDIEIRKHASVALENSFLSPWIQTIESSSTDLDTFQRVSDIAEDYKCVMVVLDSHHTKSHVLNELKLFSKLVTKGSYLIVFDTVIEFLSEQLPDREWRRGDSPFNAVQEFLLLDKTFTVDSQLDSMLGISCAPSGFLLKI